MYTQDEYKTYLKVKHELLLKDCKHYVLKHFKADDNEDSEYTRYILKTIDLEQIANSFESEYDDSFLTWETWDRLINDYVLRKTKGEE